MRLKTARSPVRHRLRPPKILALSRRSSLLAGADWGRRTRKDAKDARRAAHTTPPHVHANMEALRSARRSRPGRARVLVARRRSVRRSRGRTGRWLSRSGCPTVDGRSGRHAGRWDGALVSEPQVRATASVALGRRRQRCPCPQPVRRPEHRSGLWCWPFRSSTLGDCSSLPSAPVAVDRRCLSRVPRGGLWV
jgi:hypothetical protein